LRCLRRHIDKKHPFSKTPETLSPPECCTLRTTSRSLACNAPLFFSPAVIEQLPMDLRDRFTEMREMDLQVQSTNPV
ncbi:hypothetical protein cypCar_00018029, partial [Cyprinus carpio]